MKKIKRLHSIYFFSENKTLDRLQSKSAFPCSNIRVQWVSFVAENQRLKAIEWRSIK